MSVKRGVALYKGIEFCTKFGDLNWGGHTIHEVIQYMPQTQHNLVFKPCALPERWLGKAAYLSHHAIVVIVVVVIIIIIGIDAILE